jgi:hypothetical protein
MKNATRLLVICIILSFNFLVFPKFMYAYIDPGTGSYVLQLIIAALISISLVIKISWTKIKTFLLKIFKKTSK